MKFERVYTARQIVFLGSHVTQLTHRELAKLFNETFNTNKSVACIKRICSAYGLKSGRTLNPPVPVGSETVDTEGYIKVKASEARHNGRRTWRNKHVLVWEAVHGPLPKGHSILFADGDKRNFSLDNLVMVTRREIFYLNKHKLHSPDAELTKTAVGIARLIAAIADKAAILERNPCCSSWKTGSGNSGEGLHKAMEK